MRLLLELGRRLDSTLSPDRASPALLLLNQNLYKWRNTKWVWCVNFHREGLFIGVNGTSTDLERSVWRQVVADQPSHMAGQPGEAASTDSGFFSSCRHVATKAQGEPPQTLAGRPAPGPTWPRVWPTWSMSQIHPRGDDDFDICSTSLCHPMKCSNLVPKFLKSNKH
jgi:hypothetical protein